MSTIRDFDDLARAWLDEGPTQLSDVALDAALGEVHSTRQRRALRVPWRFPLMPALSRATAVATVALVAVVGAGGALYLSSTGGIGGRTTPAPTVTPAPTTQPTAAPSIQPAIPQLLDTTLWTPLTSTVYGFTMAYPPGWAINQEASRPWAIADGRTWSSPAFETFTSPEGDLAVSVWGVAIDPNMDPSVASSWGQFEGWIETFCTLTANEPCTGIHGRVVPMCPDRDTECHTGAMIVPFGDNVAGFKGGERGGITIVVDGEEVTYWVVVTVWQPEDFPGLARYGGGTRLIQAFLETMGARMPTRGPVDHDDHPVRSASPSPS